MSRNEGRIHVGDEKAVDAGEILAEIAAGVDVGHPLAIARYLSGADDWKEALKTLGGAFAPANRDEEREEDG